MNVAFFIANALLGNLKITKVSRKTLSRHIPPIHHLLLLTLIHKLTRRDLKLLYKTS